VLCCFNTHNTLFNNIIYSNGVGISLLGSFYNSIYNNNIHSNIIGIELVHSVDGGNEENTLIDNNVSNNNQGINMDWADRNTLRGNAISNNSDNGISICSASDNMISTNIISNNKIGIRLCVTAWINIVPLKSINNTIYDNYFLNINNLIFEFKSPNNWSSTKTSGLTSSKAHLGGNFWANPSGTGFSQTCSDAKW